MSLYKIALHKSGVSKNIDLILKNNLPKAVASGDQRKINGILDVLKGNEKVLVDRLPRFRPEFVNQVPGAQQKISKGLAELGL